MTDPAYIRATHRYAYRAGQWAKVSMRVPAAGPDGTVRDCWLVTWPDDATDLWPVQDPDAGYETWPPGDLVEDGPEPGGEL